MEQLEFKSLNVGDKLKGTVINVEKEEAFLDVGASCDAKIDKQHYSFETVNDLRKVINKDDILEVMVTYVSDEQILLSRLPFEKEIKFNAIKEKMATEEVFTLTFEKFNRGGLEHRDVFTYFMPASQIGVKGAEPKDYVDKPFDVIITDVNEQRQQFVVSARKVADKAYQAKKAEALTQISQDAIIPVKITQVVDAGIEIRFQDIIRGFVPRKQLSHIWFEKVTDLYSVGDTLDVKVIEVKDNGQFIGSIKATMPTPWETFAATHKDGDIVEGKIKRIIEIGAFVEVTPGVEGLLHRSEVTYDDFANFRDIISEGESVQVKILLINQKDKKLSLSIKKLAADPWDDLWEKYHVGDLIEVTVKRIERNHMWVSIVQYVDAMLYRREALMKENQELSDVYKEGETLKVKITEINPKRRRIVVSLAAIERDEEQKQLNEYCEKIQATAAAEINAFKGKFSTVLDDTKVVTENTMADVKADIQPTVDAVKEKTTEVIADVKAQAADVKADIQPTVDAVKEKTTEVIADVKAQVADVKADIQPTIDAVKEKTTEVIGTVSEKVAETAKKISEKLSADTKDTTEKTETE